MSVTARQIRRAAFQALFQLDARGAADPSEIISTLSEESSLKEKDVKAAFDIALNAFNQRAAADSAMEALAPTWPAHRQPAVDRAILRLAHFEMTSAKINPKIVVNDAIELAKEFSTDKSPAFVNGLLDKILKQVLAESPGLGALPEDESASPDPALS